MQTRTVKFRLSVARRVFHAGDFSILLESAEKGPNLQGGLTQRKVNGQKNVNFFFENTYGNSNYF